MVDVAGADVGDNEVLAHALMNMSQKDKEAAWAVRRSSSFVNEYPRVDASGRKMARSPENPNHLLGSFPCLFPYGEGGLKVERKKSVSYDAHVRWCLRYEDRRFRHDLHFIFQAFGVSQKRQVCAAAVLQITKHSFRHHENAIKNLKPEDLAAAGVDEQAGRPYTHPVIRSLHWHLCTVWAKVMGTDESRVKIRSRIWGMCMMKNPPSIWLTINPADMQDPIAQVLTGWDIDLDHFDKFDDHFSPNAVASDPFASAAFFHLIVPAVLQCLLGICGYENGKHIQREKGILGVINGYVGTVEAQGRGTLHLHMVLWLKGSVTSSQMKEFLLSEQFRNRVKAFIGANIKADLSGFPGAKVLAIPKEKKVAFSRPVDPRSDNYDKRRQESEVGMARMVQVHQCGPSCMKVTKS